ncbi:MAG: hypothetical protein ACFFAU_00985 [Candidatus Hodarchaeota archaeon]
MPNRGKDGGSSPHKERLYQQYASSNRRYKNKVKKAKKRFGRCKPEILQKIIDKIVKHRKNYKKAG